MTQASAEMERLRELLARATPGPWEAIDGDLWDQRGDGMPGVPIMREDRGTFRSWGRKLEDAEREANAALIVEGINALPSLLARIEKLEAENGRLREALGEAREWLSGWLSAEPYISIIDAALKGDA